MMRIATMTISLAGCLLCAAGDVPAPAGGARGAAEPDRVKLLVEGNIFLRRRRSPPPVVAAPPAVSETVDRPEPTDPAFDLVFNGVALQGADRIALIEDRGSGRRHRKGVGDVLAGLEVTRIDLDQMTVAIGGSSRTIALGQRLTGQPVARSSDTSAAVKAGHDDEDPKAGDAEADPAENPITRRLRLRRQRELRRSAAD